MSTAAPFSPVFFASFVHTGKRELIAFSRGKGQMDTHVSTRISQPNLVSKKATLKFTIQRKQQEHNGSICQNRQRSLHKRNLTKLWCSEVLL